MEHLFVGRVDLPAAEADHARRARRLSVGDPVVIFNGRGSEGRGTITRCSPAGVEVIVEKLNRRPRPRPALSLAVAMPKGARGDLLIDKCTELGVAGLQPLSTERSVGQVSEHKLDRWRRATIEVAKQSQQAWLPALASIEKLPEFLRRLPRLHPEKGPCEASAERPLFTCSEGHNGIEDIWREPFDRILLAAVVPTCLSSPHALIVDQLAELKFAHHVLAFVGPEGGWTDEETRWILDAGAIPVSLGPNILRIETAAISLAAFFHGLASRDHVHPPLDGVEN